jgi:hypothetical protein
MKKTLITLALTAVCAGAFAQGKINILNDSLHYVTDQGGALLSGASYMVDLYGYSGTGGGSMALLTSIPLNPALPGIFGPFNWNSPLPGGSASTFQVRVRDTANALANGQSQTFTMQPGGSIAYNSLINPGGTTLSTWAIGQALPGGGFGSITVIVPEPTSMVLAGLGAASLLLFRRRN